MPTFSNVIKRGKTAKLTRLTNYMPKGNKGNSTSPGSVSLPSGWKMDLDEDGHVYFTNGTYTQWNFPVDTPLPEGWEKLATDDNQIYYYNTKTKTSSWFHPDRTGKARNLDELNLSKRVKERNAKIAELEKQVLNFKERPVLVPLSMATEALVAPTTNANDPEVAPFKRMLKMGIPEGAVRQKMAMAGVNASRVFGGPSTTAGPMGRPVINLSKKLPLRKVGNTTRKNNTNKKPNSRAGLMAELTGALKTRKQGPINLNAIGKKLNKPNKPPNARTGLMAELAGALKTRKQGPVNFSALEKKRNTNKNKKPNLSALQGAVGKLKKTTTTVKNVTSQMYQNQKAKEAAYKQEIAALKQKGNAKNEKIETGPAASKKEENWWGWD